MASSHALAGFTQTVFNVLTTLVGVGVVGLPYAVAQAGWICGLIMITIATGLAIYCGTLLAVCMNNGVPGYRFLTYMEMGEHVMGRTGHALGWYASLGSCLAASVFFIVAGIEQFQVLFPDLPLSPAEWATVFLVVVLPLCNVKSLGHAGAVSFIGAATSGITMAMVTALIVYDYMVGKTRHLDTRTSLWPPADLAVLCKSFVTIIFSLGGMCVFPEVSRCMERPADFGKAIVVACALTYVFYLVLVCTAYGLFGQHLLATPNYANVVKMLSNNWMAKVTASAMQLHLITAFVVTIMPVFRAMEDRHSIDEKAMGALRRFCGRTLLVGGCLLVAILVPFFGDIMAFVGASMDSLSGVILPCFFFVILFNIRDPVHKAKEEREAHSPLLVDSRMASEEDIAHHVRLRPGRAKVVLSLAIGACMVGVAVLGSYQAAVGIAQHWYTYFGHGHH